MSDSRTHLVLGPLALDDLQPALNLLLLRLRHDAGLEQRLGERNGALDIRRVHSLVVLERLVELVHPAISIPPVPPEDRKQRTKGQWTR